MKAQRELDIAIISDIHLGTFGSKANECANYLKSIRPRMLILNGDVFDGWQFNKRYWPKSHTKVIRQLITMMADGVKIVYITGNHDETMRKFAGIKLDNLEIANYYILHLGNQKAWAFHGDVFDVTMQHSKWLAKLGAKGYGLLILLNRAVNALSATLGRGPVSLSKRIKNGVKSAGKSKTIFEETVTEIAAQKGYNYVICGHIHQPEIKRYQHGTHSVLYLNSGDWVENMSALEYQQGQWALYTYQADPLEAVANTSALPALEELSHKLLFMNLLSELELLKS